MIAKRVLWLTVEAYAVRLDQSIMGVTMLKRLLLAVLLAISFACQAAVYSLPWGPKPQFVDANGAPMSGGTLLTFVGSSTTPQVTYTDSTGGTGNPTTITLNVRGETPNEVWLTGGVSYKFILKDSAGATVWTVDNISGVNDVTSALDEWKAGPAPTFVSTTSFTLVGDQTVEFHKGRRLKTTNSGGTVYSTITASVFGASTTVTVANDSSVLDAGLSAVSYGIVRAVNPSISPDMVSRKGAAVASASTTDIWSIVGDFVHVTGTVTITSFGTAPYAGAQRTIVFDGALTLTYNATTLILPGAANITTVAGDTAICRADTTANVKCVSYFRAVTGSTPIKRPTQQAFTSASGTYTTPTGATWLRVRMVGAGAGGAGGGNSGTNGSAGGNTTFSTYTAGGGGAPSGSVGGAGGSASGGNTNVVGQAGAGGPTGLTSLSISGGAGGSTPFGGGGAPGQGGAVVGGAAATNSGGGGAGGGIAAQVAGAGGGGAGGYVEAIITAPAATYSYAIGAAGTGGSGNVGGNGGAGAAGYIVVDEFYE